MGIPTPDISLNNTPVVSPNNSPPQDNLPDISPYNSCPKLTRYCEGQKPFEWEKRDISADTVTNLISDSLNSLNFITFRKSEISGERIIINFSLEENNVDLYHHIDLSRADLKCLIIPKLKELFKEVVTQSFDEIGRKISSTLPKDLQLPWAKDVCSLPQAELQNNNQSPNEKIRLNR